MTDHTETPDLAELRRLAEAARDLPAGSDWLHGEVGDDTTETVAEWMDKCSANPDAPAAGRLRLVWSEGSGETKVIIQAIVGDTETAPVRAAFMANANPTAVLALLDAAAERDELAAKVEALADWHETKADKARWFRVEIDGQNRVMDKAAEVHTDAARRLRHVLTEDKETQA